MKRSSWIGRGSGWTVLLSLVAAVVLAASARSAASSTTPSDPSVQRIIAHYEMTLETLLEAGEDYGTARRQAADAALEDVDLAAMSFEQLDALLMHSPVCELSSRSGEVDARLETFGERRTVAGARARILRLNFLDGKSGEAQRTIIVALLEHPKLEEALRSGALWSSFMNFEWHVEPSVVEGLEPRLIALGEHIPERAPMLGVLGAINIFSIVAASEPDGHETREPLRRACVAALHRLAKYVNPNDPSLRNWNFAEDIPGHIDREITRLESPAVRGTLIDGPAPQIEFIRVIGAEEHFTSLRDLRGRIVVLDFWTTWCRPCIASFPDMRRLVDRYDDHPITFIGVTSIQGWHYPSGGGERIDCTGEPEREMKLMETFIEDKDLTWPVAFSQQPVYNPDYNIRGIPHVIIIDEDGKVRANGLHPHLHHDRIMRRIDALLGEMDLEPPAKPTPPPASKDDS